MKEVIRDDVVVCREECMTALEAILQTERGRVIMVSDPPFNIGYHYNTYEDKMSDSEYFTTLSTIFSQTPSVVIHYPESLYKLSYHMKKFPEKVCSWVYNSNTPKQHRDIAYFGVVPDFNQVRQPYKNPNDKRIQERIRNGSKGGRLYDWWNVNQVKNVSKTKCKHPCQMPVEVMRNVVGVLPMDSIIIDPFMGTGTTGVAVIEMNREQGTKRKFIGIELDEEYFDIAKQRLIESINKGL